MLCNGLRRLSGRESTFKGLRYGMVGIPFHVSLQYHSAWEIHRPDYEGVDHSDTHVTGTWCLLRHDYLAELLEDCMEIIVWHLCSVEQGSFPQGTRV